MSGLAREIARRRRQDARRAAAAEPPPPPPPPPVRCSAGNEAGRCCVGDPWATFSPHDVEPLPPAVIRVAADHGVEPHALDEHVEAIHGWEPHDVGYDAHVAAAALCLLDGGCQ